MAALPVLRRALPLAGAALLPVACGHPAREARPRPDAAETPRRGREAAPPAGVVRPPVGVDPGIQAPVPVPNPGTTPVIPPPPGAPGGDARLRPR